MSTTEKISTSEALSPEGASGLRLLGDAPITRGQHRHSVPFEEWYQSPQWCCEIMANLVPSGVRKILEPTPGEGRLVQTLRQRGYEVMSPERFEDLDPWLRVDATVMNPPFKKSIEHKYLTAAMAMSDIVIALMPWFTLINSDSRTAELVRWGLKTVIHLPRSTFRHIRVQPCILHLERGHSGNIGLRIVGRGGAAITK